MKKYWRLFSWVAYLLAPSLYTGPIADLVAFQWLYYSILKRNLIKYLRLYEYLLNRTPKKKSRVRLRLKMETVKMSNV